MGPICEGLAAMLRISSLLHFFIKRASSSLICRAESSSGPVVQKGSTSQWNLLTGRKMTPKLRCNEASLDENTVLHFGLCLSCGIQLALPLADRSQHF